MTLENIQAFACVDQACDPHALVRFLETAAARYFGPLNARSYDLLRLAPGASVLDVGCGTGQDAAAMRALVGSEGEVVGVDSSQVMLSEAIRRMTEAGLSIKFQLGDAQSLAFEDATFDAVRSSRLLCHVQEPRRALTEMIRVLRLGGYLAAIEPDHETLVITSPHRNCTRKIVNSFVDGFRHGWTGRWLPVWCWEFGLQEIQVEPFTIQMDYQFVMEGLGLQKKVQQMQEAGLIAAEEASAWMSYQEQAAEIGLFYSAITFFMVAGRKM